MGRKSQPEWRGTKLLEEIEEASLNKVLTSLRAHISGIHIQQQQKHHHLHHDGNAATGQAAAPYYHHLSSQLPSHAAPPPRVMLRKSFPIHGLDALIAAQQRATGHAARTHGPLVSATGRYMHLVHLLVARLIAAPLRQAVVVVDLEHRFDVRRVLEAAGFGAQALGRDTCRRQEGECDREVQQEVQEAQGPDMRMENNETEETQDESCLITPDDLKHVHVLRLDLEVPEVRRIMRRVRKNQKSQAAAAMKQQDGDGGGGGGCEAMLAGKEDSGKGKGKVKIALPDTENTVADDDDNTDAENDDEYANEHLVAAALANLESHMLYGPHESHDREWWGTILLAGDWNLRFDSASASAAKSSTTEGSKSSSTTRPQKNKQQQQQQQQHAASNPLDVVDMVCGWRGWLDVWRMKKSVLQHMAEEEGHVLDTLTLEEAMRWRDRRRARRRRELAAMRNNGDSGGGNGGGEGMESYDIDSWYVDGFDDEWWASSVHGEIRLC